MLHTYYMTLYKQNNPNSPFSHSMPGILCLKFPFYLIYIHIIILQIIFELILSSTFDMELLTSAAGATFTLIHIMKVSLPLPPKKFIIMSL